MLKKAISIAAISGLSVMSSMAHAEFGDFTVNTQDLECTNIAVCAAAGVEFTADKLNGGYAETITIELDGSYTATGLATFAQFFANEGVTPLGSDVTHLANRLVYGLTAEFMFTGNAGSFNPVTQTFSVDSGTFDLFGNNGTGDVLLASATNVTFGSGTAANIDAFEIIWSDFTLTAKGEDYFIDPDPFYLEVTVDGDFDQDPVFILGDTVQAVGDVSAVFEIPTPDTLALLGLGLIGMGVSARRRKSA